MTGPRICVVGSSNIDLSFRTPRLPAPGETLHGPGFHIGFGGKGANQAIMAARMGASVAMISRVGRDVFGDQILRNFADAQIDISHVLIDDQLPTGAASIAVDDQGQNAIIVVGGANMSISPQHVEAARPLLAGASVVLAQLEVPIEAVTAAFRIAREAGITTILNPAPAHLDINEVLQLSDYCIPNESELSFMMNAGVETLDKVIAAARGLNARGPRTTIVTLGENGAAIVGPSITEHVPVSKVTAVDTTGAGDAFIGSFAVFLAEGHSVTAAVALGNAAAALTVQRPGAQASYPRRKEINIPME